MDSVEPTRIGLWGPNSAGKTTYLASVYLNRNQVGWEIKPDLDHPQTRQLVEGERGPVAQLSLLRFPEASAPGQVLDYFFHFTVPAQRPSLLRRKTEDLSFTVNLIDVSGEEIGLDQSVREDYFERLRECDGMLLMLDASAEHAYAPSFEDYRPALTQLVNQVDRPALYWAFCITKVDLDDYWAKIAPTEDMPEGAAQRELQDIVREIIGEKAYDEVAFLFDRGRARVFPISSVGRYGTSAGSRPNLVEEHIDGELQRRLVHSEADWEPVGIYEPLKWIFEHVFD